MTRILVADGMNVVRAAVRNVLAAKADFEVVEAATTADVLALVAGESPDLALVDLELPPNGALEAIAALDRDSHTGVIVWSSNPERRTVVDAIRAGADGYLPKEIAPEALVRALRGAARGEAPMSRELTALMIEELQALDAAVGAREKAAALSAREREVLALVADGARNADIASALAISPFTVKRHVQNILRKLEVASRGEAGAFYASAFVPAGPGMAS